MHPAYSVILFTTASGAGYGLLIGLAIAVALNLVPRDPMLGFFGLGIALVLITVGLLSSTFHLGRPERAWRAFSQWRSSWLSREGVAALATYLPAGLLGFGWVFGEIVAGQIALGAWLAVPCALVTLWCTGMIYASLPTIRAWHQPLVAPLYLVLGLATGGVLLTCLLAVFGLRCALGGGGERGPARGRMADQGALLVGDRPCGRNPHRRSGDRARPLRHGAPARSAAHPAQFRDARDGLSGGAAPRAKGCGELTSVLLFACPLAACLLAAADRCRGP